MFPLAFLVAHLGRCYPAFLFSPSWYPEFALFDELAFITFVVSLPRAGLTVLTLRVDIDSVGAWVGEAASFPLHPLRPGLKPCPFGCTLCAFPFLLHPFVMPGSTFWRSRPSLLPLGLELPRSSGRTSSDAETVLKIVSCPSIVGNSARDFLEGGPSFFFLISTLGSRPRRNVSSDLTSFCF